MGPFEQVASALHGERLIDFRYTAHGVLSLSFGSQKRAGTKASKRLWIECAWRLTSSDSIVVGTWDDPQAILAAFRAVVGATVSSVEIKSGSGDVRIALDNDFAVETFSNATDSERWEYRRSDGLRLGLGAGLTAFARNAEPDK